MQVCLFGFILYFAETLLVFCPVVEETSASVVFTFPIVFASLSRFWQNLMSDGNLCCLLGLQEGVLSHYILLDLSHRHQA